MTNYEWLVKHDCMPTFVHLLMQEAIPEIQKRYGLPDEYRDYIADWLEQEREFEEFVSLKEITKIINKQVSEFARDYTRIPIEEQSDIALRLSDSIMSKIHELPVVTVDE